MKQTTTKPTLLAYRPVGSGNKYNLLTGVLKGLSIDQEEADATEIESQFFDSPFDIFYSGKPVTMNFELVNFDLSELPELFGGTYEEISSNGDKDVYTSDAYSFTSENEWRLEFQRGWDAIIIYRGLTIGTIKKDSDGALSFNVSIVSLVHTKEDGSECLYKITANIEDSPIVIGETLAFGYEQEEYPYVEDEILYFNPQEDRPNVEDEEELLNFASVQMIDNNIYN